MDLLPYNTTWLRATKIAMPEKLKEKYQGTIRVGWNEFTEAIYVTLIHKQQKKQPQRQLYIGSVHLERHEPFNGHQPYRNRLNKEARKLAKDKDKLTEIIEKYTENQKTPVGQMTYTNYFRRECP